MTNIEKIMNNPLFRFIIDDRDLGKTIKKIPRSKTGEHRTQSIEPIVVEEDKIIKNMQRIIDALQKPKEKIITKSKFVTGLQCPKLLWFMCNQPETIPPVDATSQRRMDVGIEVGELARTLYPKGILVPRARNLQEHSAISMQTVRNNKALFEPGFLYKNLYARADILVPAGRNTWDIIEVKSSGKVKPEDGHIHDVAVQKFVLQKAGLKIRRTNLMHINTGYVRGKSLNVQKLFTIEDITDSVDEIFQDIPNSIKNLTKTINMRKCPCVDVGLQCGLGCGLYPKCWDFLPAKDNVFMLRRGKTLALEFMNEGILRMKDIPGDVELKPYQHIQVQAHVRNKPYINKEDIREFLQKLQYPLYFLDFETINPGIPVYENSRPYQRIPFQFSLHVVEKVNAKPVHHSFLADGAGDPRAEVLNRLKKLLGTTGSIVAYYAGFEAGCLKEMARDLGKYIPWMKTIDKRFVDLMEPFDKFAYYDPKQCGSASIKAVLPALTGLSYDKMKIADGGTASNEFWRIVTEKNMPFAEIKQIRKSLEEYCGLDTKGMIEIVHVLKNNI